MGSLTLKISEDFTSFSGVRHSTKEAWAAYVRRRWPTNCQAMCEREWDLSPGRANGLVWSNATQPTVDQILHHKRGGPLLALEVEAVRFGLGIDAFLERCAEQEREALAHERRQFEAREARVRAMEALARERRSFRRDDAGQGAVLAGRGRGERRLEAARVGGGEALTRPQRAGAEDGE